MNNLIRLHTLICENKGESEESDRIRDEIDTCYESLSEDDKEWLGKLSANLYALTSSVENGNKYI